MHIPTYIDHDDARCCSCDATIDGPGLRTDRNTTGKWSKRCECGTRTYYDVEENDEGIV